MTSTIDEPWGAFTCWSSILTILANSGPFRALLLTVRGPERFPQWMIPGVRLRVRRQHTQFWPILTRFVDYYSPVLGRKAISIVVEPQGALTCWSSTLTYLAILACFVDYYSLFWGPRVISTINEPWSAFTLRSSTLAVFIDSDPLCGLLLTVLGPQSDFHSC